MSVRPTIFNPKWLEKPEFKDWLRQDPASNRTFKCSPCKATVGLSNSGISAEENTCPKINTSPKINTMKIVFFDPRAYMITYIMVII